MYLYIHIHASLQKRILRTPRIYTSTNLYTDFISIECGCKVLGCSKCGGLHS